LTFGAEMKSRHKSRYGRRSVKGSEVTIMVLKKILCLNERKIYGFE
jgi:hypothetical protein